MTHSPLTTGVRLTSDCSSRNGRRVRKIILHHGATASLNGILELFQPGGRTVSANYAIKDRNVILAVDEDLRAWTSSSVEDDGEAITVEIANSATGGAWPVSDETFDTVARWIADISLRYGFAINNGTVLTHQELWTIFRRSYPTACPGDLQRRKPELLALANHYRATGNPAGGAYQPFGGFLMALSDAQQQAVYDALVSSGGYTYTGAIINILRDEIATAIASVAAGGILFPGAGYSAFPAVINAIREAGGAEPAEVDEAALAAELAPALAPLIVANLGKLDDSTVQRVAKAVNDELARRAAN